MAWFGLDRFFLGTDLSAEEQRANQLDAQLHQANQALENAGYVQPGYTAAADQSIAAADLASGASDVVGSVNSEFVAGAEQGLHNVLAVPGHIVGAAGSLSGELLWGILKKIPWWVWIVAAGALFVWMGGLSLLRGRLAHR